MAKNFVKWFETSTIKLDKYKFKIIHFAFALYILGAFWVALHNEPWFDEAQG